MHHIKAIPVVALFGIMLSLFVAFFFFSKSPSLHTPLPAPISPTPTIIPMPTSIGLPEAPAGCTYQQIKCITTPCDPILICPDEPEPSPVVSKGCVVGGCSSQLCVDASDSSSVISTCEYKDTYACYKTATCARQANGKCGWTSTPDLLSCLSNPPALF